MDKPLQTPALYKSRGFSGRLSESFKFLEKNFTQIIKISIVGLLPAGLLSALCMTFMPVLQTANLAVAVGIIGLLLVLTLGASLYFHSFIYAMIEKYGELGYVPTLKLKGWWPLMKPKMGRVLLLNLFMLFFVLLAMAIIAMPYLLSLPSESETPVEATPMWGVWVSLFLLLLFVVAVVPLFLMPGFYLLGGKTLMNSFTESYKVGMPHWGATFGIALFTTIIYELVSLLGGLPFYITEWVEYLVALAAEDGNVAVLPFYYTAMRVLFALLLTVIAYFASLFVSVPMAFHYASLVTMEKEKEGTEQVA